MTEKKTSEGRLVSAETAPDGTPLVPEGVLDELMAVSLYTPGG